MFRKLSKQPNLTIWLSLIFALLTACGTSKQSEPTMAAEPTNSVGSLSRQDRIEIFEDVWGTINEEYYDPSFNGVDWREVHQQYRPRAEAATIKEISPKELTAITSSVVGGRKPSSFPSIEVSSTPQPPVKGREAWAGCLERGTRPRQQSGVELNPRAQLGLMEFQCPFARSNGSLLLICAGFRRVGWAGILVSSVTAIA